MDNKPVHDTIRIDHKGFAEFRYIAATKRRSVNKEIKQFKKCVTKYEQQNNVISNKQ